MLSCPYAIGHWQTFLMKFKLADAFTLSDSLINDAKAPILKMLDISEKLGL